MRTSDSNGIREQLAALAGEAVAVVRELLRDPNTPQPIRLQAAKLVLSARISGGDDDEPVEKSVPGTRLGPRLVERPRGPKSKHVA